MGFTKISNWVNGRVNISDNSARYNIFNKDINTYLSILVLLIASFTYISTIEPTASFWDCGEFIASSYNLEVGHAPGNPVFQIISRVFTLFGDKESAAILVNLVSALCSAFAIYFLFLTIILLGGGSLAALLGSLAYCFSDTFWFSAVEGEVYAMSSLFTAIVFWAMLMWRKEADEPYSNRWIILISFLMGLSIGVHLLNLLTIPALVFIYYYKRYEVTVWRSVLVLGLSGVILVFVLYGIIPWLPKLAAYADLFFVNVLGAGVNLGAVIFVLFVLFGAIWGVYFTYKKGKVLLNTILLCFTMICIGYSVFAVVVIRSCTDTPTNIYQPDNPFTLLRYLAREQYGDYPLIYGEHFASESIAYERPKYYNFHDGKYIKLNGTVEVKYSPKSKMLFPRMWSNSDSHVAFYKMYTSNGGSPSMKDNLKFFWEYQINYMYIRYFMWNFVGRQNDLHGTIPGDSLKGNWESGVKFLDEFRLGDNSSAPSYISESRAKNHYYFLPLILGVLGLIWQWRRDRQGWNIIMLLFFLTGIAIVLYLNQPPFQVRERDYAYAGSFYAFCIWIGFGTCWVRENLSGLKKVGFLLLGVPALMAYENWDDHDRGGRYTVREMAYNILAPLDSNAILVTHSDNDTYPLWYLQGVEEIRRDVRIMNTSLLGIDWYIDQMKRKTYESAPVRLSIEREQYFYGTNDGVYINERVTTPVLASDVIDIFKNPRIKTQSPFMMGEQVNYIAAREIVIPVNKEAVMRNKIVPECDYDKIVDSVVLSIPKDKFYLTKDELIILDMLSNYDWKRPLYFLGVGAVNIGVKNWLQFEGFAYRFVPIKSDTGVYEMNCSQTNLDKVYDTIINVWDWKSLGDTTIHIDYQNLITFSAVCPPRAVAVTAAEAFYYKWVETKEEQYKLKALELLNYAFVKIPDANIPLSTSNLDSRNDIVSYKGAELFKRLE